MEWLKLFFHPNKQFPIPNSKNTILAKRNLPKVRGNKRRPKKRMACFYQPRVPRANHSEQGLFQKYVTHWFNFEGATCIEKHN